MKNKIKTHSARAIISIVTVGVACLMGNIIGTAIGQMSILPAETLLAAFGGVCLIAIVVCALSAALNWALDNAKSGKD